jgi:hypothetical protein
VHFGLLRHKAAEHRCSGASRPPAAGDEEPRHVRQPAPSHRKPSCVPPGCSAAASCPHLHSRKPPFPQSDGCDAWSGENAQRRRAGGHGHDAIRFVPKDHRTGVDTMRTEDGTSGMTALPTKAKSRLLCRCGESAGTITAKTAIAGRGSDGHGH